MIVIYQQIKTPIGLCRQWLNSRSFIQQLEILSVEVTGIHHYLMLGCIVLQFFFPFKYLEKLTKYICNDSKKVIVTFAFLP